MWDWWYSTDNNDNDGCGNDLYLTGAAVLILIGIALFAIAVIINA